MPGKIGAFHQSVERHRDHLLNYFVVLRGKHEAEYGMKCGLDWPADYYFHQNTPIAHALLMQHAHLPC